MRAAVVGLAVAICFVARVDAQRPGAPVPEPPLPSLTPAGTAALDGLSQRYASDVTLHQGWFRDRAILYYDFGPVPDAVGRVLWPIHGFDARGYPVAIRGQKPIFSTIPGIDDYSGIWRLAYVIVADKYQPNQIRDIASAEALVASKRAVLTEAPGTLNLAVVAKGSRLERDSTPPMMGWYEGREVQFFDFGAAGTQPVPLWAFITGKDSAGDPQFLREQINIVDTLPVTPPYADLWHIRFAKVDTLYVPNTLKSAAAVSSAAIAVEPPHAIRNCPVAIVDGARVQRVPSPISAFADLRSPFPPAFTRPAAIAADTTRPPER